ncbi:hypothetical protein LBMAG49_18540 [Planctomycetota bacterium]|nr:hypothetical protein LBMAG49_18540 [Planctomycetota bacterium]
MNVGGGPPRLPLLRLRCSSTERLRSLLTREPQWGFVLPQVDNKAGDDAIARYRLRSDSFFVEVHFHRQGEQWVERDCQIVPGASVTLRLVLNDCDPARITKQLGIEPSRAWAKGDVEAPLSARGEGLWIREVLPAAMVYAEEKVQELLALLRSCAGWRTVVADPAVQWALITIQFYGCREQMSGLSLDRTVLEDLVALSLQVDVQVSAE